MEEEACDLNIIDDCGLAFFGAEAVNGDIAGFSCLDSLGEEADTLNIKHPRPILFGVCNDYYINTLIHLPQCHSWKLPNSSI